ncbi:MAG: ABC transporter substrate-binding protein [Peptococcaceae bacterium]|jgi:peptide/nickel transport system substrate-binding protein/oligopeptide transport system substrate-binding protein|nr:ABC transporter substrate-binding protein [Peptococcaceae bacterium]
MKIAGWQKGAAIVLTLALLATVLAGCGTSAPSGSSAASAGKPVTGGTIRLDMNMNFKDLDPAKAYDTASYEITEQLYDRLVTYKGTTSEIVPMVAKSWDISQDGKTYTFHLHKNVKFWNGDPVTAQSFIDEFQRVLDPAIGSGGEGFIDPIVVGSTAYNKGQAKTVAGLFAPDPDTLVVKLTQPEPFFLNVVAMPFFSAVDQKFIDKVGNQAFDTKDAMGSGPFELQSYSTSEAVLTRNHDYFMVDQYGNHLPYLNKVILTVNTDDQLDGMHFENGQTAFMGWNMGGDIPSSLYPKFLSDPTLKKDIVTEPQNATYYLGLNNKMKPFNTPLVRQAVEYAIDKQEILKLMNNRFIAADQPLPPGIEGYVKHLAPDATYTYDPDKARQLLAEAGYKDGFTTTLYSDNQVDDKKIDAAVQSMLQNVGITVKIDAMDWNSFLALNEKGQTPFFQLAWTQDFPDASDFLNTLFNTNQQPMNNATMYSNPQVDAWLNQAQTMPNDAARFQIYKQVTNQIMKDADWVPMYYGNSIFAVQPWVHGFYINATLMDPLQYIWIDQSHSANS